MPTYLTLSTLGFILDFVGKVMVSFTAIMVHHRFWKEHKVDEQVFMEMHKERKIGLIGVAFLIIGFILQLPGKF